ncbi:hypothetical protein AUK10_03145 [Candidatus Gracilibacteria bacterium CG2_30_37_12]|nr:MAG: hypothetical protein AUK10_03145 [Candidatus Gracilibacteria bacterium CG2_30_37_12]
MEKRLDEITSTVNDRTNFDTNPNIMLPKGFHHFGSDKGGEVLYIQGNGSDFVIKFTQEGDKITVVAYQNNDNGDLVLAGGEKYGEIVGSKRSFKAGDKIDLTNLALKSVDISGLPNIIESIKKVPKEYREGYYKQDVREDGESLVSADSYGIKGEDMYGKYASEPISSLVKKKGLEGIMSITSENSLPDEGDISKLKFDTFNTMSDPEKEQIIREIAKKLNIELKGVLDNKVTAKIRDILVLSYNNSRLRSLGISKKIEVRKEVAEKLSIVNRSLVGTGFSIGIQNGLRTSEIQRTIKENHELFKGKQEADRLFASEENSPHLSGGAIDVYLIQDGKEIDLKIGDNSPETKSPLYVAKNPKEQKKLDLRNTILVTMAREGFAVNPTEYWHFCYGDKMWAYIQEQTTGKPTTAMYDTIKK